MALENQLQIEALADNLSACADEIHERLMKAIRHKEIDQFTAQSIFQEEASLRQRANSLYIDAANCVVAGLNESQDSLMGVIDTAKEKIQTIREIASFVDLIADIIVLAAAACAAKPGPILSALQEIKNDVDALS